MGVNEPNGPRKFGMRNPSPFPFPQARGGKYFGGFTPGGARPGGPPRTRLPGAILFGPIGAVSMPHFVRRELARFSPVGKGGLILRGKKIGYAAIRGRLSGNTRQGIGPSSAYCRVLPDIAA